MARYGMVIDTLKCVGSQDCVIACEAENNVPEGFCLGSITTEAKGTFPTIQLEIRTERCNHCTDAPCVSACSTGASHYHDVGGVVLVTHVVAKHVLHLVLTMLVMFIPKATLINVRSVFTVLKREKTQLVFLYAQLTV